MAKRVAIIRTPGTESSARLCYLKICVRDSRDVLYVTRVHHIEFVRRELRRLHLDPDLALA